MRFTRSNEYLAAGLGDGLVKVWDLTRKDVRRIFKPSNYQLRQSVTSVQFNPKNDMLGASNNQGHISIFPMLDSLEKESGLPKGASSLAPVTLNEVVQLKSLGGECSVNKFEFSPFIDNMVASGQDDG